MNGHIFISYRRADTAGTAGRLYDRLSERFGGGRIFMDIDSIALGIDFAKRIDEAVGACEVLIVVVGRDWLYIKDEEGRRRLDNPDDFVRLEIEAALARNIPIIPILAEDAKMPATAKLPDSLKPFVSRNGMAIHHESFDSDADLLIQKLLLILRNGEAPSGGVNKRLWIAGGLLAAAVITGVLAVRYYEPAPPGPNQKGNPPPPVNTNTKSDVAPSTNSSPTPAPSANTNAVAEVTPAPNVAPTPSQNADRISAAFEDLAHDNFRMDALNRLEGLAKQSPDDHWRVMQYLTKYVQTNARWRKGGSRAAEKIPEDLQRILKILGRRKWTYMNGEPDRLDLRDTDLRGADLRVDGGGADFKGFDLRGAHLEDAHLRGIRFDEARLNGTHFERANLFGACFYNADINGANFSGADLRGTKRLLPLPGMAHSDGNTKLPVFPTPNCND